MGSIILFFVIYTLIFLICLFLFAAIQERYDKKKNDDLNQLV